MQARVAARERRIDEARRQFGEFEVIMQKRGKLPEDNDIYRWLAGYVAYYAKDYDRADRRAHAGEPRDPFILYLIGHRLRRQRRLVERAGSTIGGRWIERPQPAAAIARPHARAKLSDSQ